MDDLVCYCFGFTVEDIRKDYLENHRSQIMEMIKKEKRLGGCRCAVKNPKKS